MRKKILYFLLGTIFIADLAFAGQTSYVFQTRQYTVILNPYIKNINLDCKISAWSGNHQLNVTGVNQLTWINGIKVSPGQNITLNITNNMKLSLNSEPAAEIRIFNPGESAIIADCSY